VSQFGVTLRNTSVDVMISVADRAKIRVLPKNEFDAKGKIKPFKPDKKDPDWKLGGRKSTFQELKKEGWVTLKLRRSGTRARPGDRYLADIVVMLGKDEEASAAPP
jgi:hypothetical protein